MVKLKARLYFTAIFFVGGVSLSTYADNKSRYIKYEPRKTEIIKSAERTAGVGCTTEAALEVFVKSFRNAGREDLKILDSCRVIKPGTKIMVLQLDREMRFFEVLIEETNEQLWIVGDFYERWYYILPEEKRSGLL
ncbi:hypothetical protein [Pseudomonas tohonis]|uniref:SH3 domain-containing protein n=1 Tax=Pseudomonas tohonis TaxID=2725477 RepID=A0ABQ4VYS2_9PSED|nr:hypothetical protein [Pseudomonas tohonis]GJN52323.1 hypothetical protein TUM20286_20750 [Pseudomonas tohonis]